MAFFLSFLSCGDHLLRRSDSFVCVPLSVLTFFYLFFFFWQWYSLMSLKGLTSNEGSYPIRIWRWKGYLIQVCIIPNLQVIVCP